MNRAYEEDNSELLNRQTQQSALTNQRLGIGFQAHGSRWKNTVLSCLVEEASDFSHALRDTAGVSPTLGRGELALVC